MHFACSCSVFNHSSDANCTYEFDSVTGDEQLDMSRADTLLPKEYGESSDLLDSVISLISFVRLRVHDAVFAHFAQNIADHFC